MFDVVHVATPSSKSLTNTGDSLFITRFYFYIRWFICVCFCLTFVNGDGVRYTVTRVQNDTSGTTRSVQGQNGLNGDIHGWGVESFKHNLGHLFSVGFGVQGSFGEKNWVFLGCDSKFIVERVMPDFLHVIPVCNDTVFNGVFQGKDTSLRLGFITNVAVFLAHTDHDTLRLQNNCNKSGKRFYLQVKTGEIFASQQT